MADFEDLNSLNSGQTFAGAYAGLSEGDIRNALQSRERYEVESVLAGPAGAATESIAEGAVSDADLRAMISERAYTLIVDFETGGRAYYESRRGLNKRACWPGGRSGVTIGCGYDLGYHSEADYRAAWAERIASQDLLVLAGSLGKKGRTAKDFMPRVSHIIIEWGVALAVFDAVNVPEEARRTLSYLPNAAGLHPHCFGALVSLVFNRGASFRLAGDRYREMREIRRLIETRDFDAIPAQFRAMKRLWEGTGQGGLLIRRDKEAQLFQDGLDAMRIAVQPEGGRQRVAAAGGGSTGGMGTTEGFGTGGDPDLSWLEGLTQDQRDAALYPPEPDNASRESLPDAGLEAPAVRYSKADVRWVSNDQNHPDYVHLPPDAKGQSFRFTPEDLETLVRCNSFEPHVGTHGRLIFALRGAQLNGGGHAQENTGELQLTDVRPNHFDFRCVIGVFDRSLRRFSAYTASTVCNAGSVVACYNYYNHISSEKKGNILLTGCYELCVGTHYGSATVPGVFRLGNGPNPENASKHTVLRTANDVTLGTQDVFDDCVPQDNLHPAFGTSDFSSLGCLTVRGTYSNGHQGEWKKLRAAASLHASQDSMGTRYDMVLLTGLDAATAALLRTRGITDAASVTEVLGCLRQGSRGPLVTKLQNRLGMTEASGTFDWKTAKMLAEHQKSTLGWASATYGRNMDALLNFEIFGAAVA